MDGDEDASDPEEQENAEIYRDQHESASLSPDNNNSAKLFMSSSPHHMLHPGQHSLFPMDSHSSASTSGLASSSHHPLNVNDLLGQ